MITSFFKKSTPLNYSLVIISMIFCFFLYHFQLENSFKGAFNFLLIVGYLALIGLTFFISNFVIKKNNLSKDSTYATFFQFCFFLFFPSVFNNPSILLANFFILLALRRLISLQTLKFPKEKIFDASFWILIASIFHFWSILFLLVVYVSIIFHVSRDYRNWLIPFVSLFAFFVLFLFFSFIFNQNLFFNYIDSIGVVDFNWDYFTSKYQNIALSMFAVVIVFFWIPIYFRISKKPLNMQATYKKIVLAIAIAITVYVLTPNKSNDILVLTFFPLATLASSFIEYNNDNLQKEIVLYGTMVLAFVAFFCQL